MSILAELHKWYELDEMQPGCCPDKSEAEKSFDALWEEVKNQINEELSEKLRASIFAYMDNECYAEFQAGFRMGALLMLELQNSAATVPR